MPSTMANITARKPTLSEVRAPYMMVDRMSRPWSSVPNRKVRSPPSSQNGGLKPSARFSRSEEHTSELQSLTRLSYAVFCLKQTILHTISHQTLYIRTSLTTHTNQLHNTL